MAQGVMDRVSEQTDETLETIKTLPGGPPFVPEPPQGPDDGEPNDGDDDGGGSPISNARLGMMMFLGAETMFFAGLIGSFLVFRFANATWPPPTFPRLPIIVTGINTLLLLYSAITMWQAQHLMRDDMRRQSIRMLSYTAALGVIFLLIQGYEWLELIGFGLTLTSGVYGATFYTLIGCHGLHVLGAVGWLLMVLWRAKRGYYTARRYTGLAICGMYWYYVVGLWPVLYWLVYLY